MNVKSIRVLRRLNTYIIPSNPSSNPCSQNLTYARWRTIILQNQALKTSLVLPGRGVSFLSSDIGKVTLPEMIFFLKKNGLPFQEGPTCLELNCPLCQTDSKEQQQQQSTPMYLNATTGTFVCYTCKNTGPWHLFQDYIGNLHKKTSQDFINGDSKIFQTEVELETVQKHFESFSSLGNLTNSELDLLLGKFKIKTLKLDTLKKFNVRISKDGKILAFPLHDPNGTLVSIRSLYEEVTSDGSREICESVFPSNPLIAVFGRQRKTLKEIVLTTTPEDSMAVAQETKMLAVSLARGNSVLPVEVLPMLEKFSKIYIWFGNSSTDMVAAKTFSKKLDCLRCHFVRLKHGPLSSLQQGQNLTDLLKEARPFVHKSVAAFSTFRDGVYGELANADKMAGIKWKRFPDLNRILKGFRLGELTILTGPTGAGKTTFVSEYSIDLCSQGVRTLWGSFEISNKRLAKIMLKQFSRVQLEENLDQFDYWADKFELLPLHFMTFHGAQPLNDVLDAMAHAVYVHDVQHIIVDNVQFMISLKDSGDRFLTQDRLISDMRKFATEHNCHITLVMHPRKEKAGLSVHSIYGGVKASQEADNILLLQVQHDAKFIQISKNRFDGEMGDMPIKFHKETLTFSTENQKAEDLKEES